MCSQRGFLKATRIFLHQYLLGKLFRMQITLNVTSNVNKSVLVGKEFYVDELSLEDADILHLCEIPNPIGMQTCLCLCHILDMHILDVFFSDWRTWMLIVLSNNYSFLSNCRKSSGFEPRFDVHIPLN